MSGPEHVDIEVQAWSPDQVPCRVCGGWNGVETEICGHCGEVAIHPMMRDDAYWHDRIPKLLRHDEGGPS